MIPRIPNQGFTCHVHAEKRIRHGRILNLISISLFFKPHKTVVRIFANCFKHMPAAEHQYTEKQRLLSRYGNALAHPVRIAILQLLSQQSCCYHGDMSEELPVANSTLSQHLKVLREAGLIQGEINPPKTKYCINAENWQLAKGLLIGFFDHS